MILVEGTFLPLVVVGAVPNSSAIAEPEMTIDAARLWSSHDLRLAIVIAGNHANAWKFQDEVFAWLAQHRKRLRRCVSRVGWIFEDDRVRRNADRWLTLAADGLFPCDVATFRSVRTAIAWLAMDAMDRAVWESSDERSRLHPFAS